MPASAAASRLIEARTTAGLSQRELAERAGTSQSAIARLERGGASPSVDTLERLLAAAGFELRLQLVPTSRPDPVVEAYKADVDRSLLRENLRRSVDERLRGLESLARLGDELQRAVGAARTPFNRSRPDK